MNGLKRYFFKFAYWGLFCYWHLFHPTTYGVKVIIKHNNKYLLVKHTYGFKSWTFPGGGIKIPERVEETARREIKEELGLRITDIKNYGHIISLFEGKKDKIWIFSAEVFSPDFVIDQVEIEHAKWFSLEELRRNTSNLSKVTLKSLKKANII